VFLGVIPDEFVGRIMFDIFFASVTNNSEVSPDLDRQCQNYSMFYNAMIHELAKYSKIHNRLLEYHETFSFMSLVMTWRERKMIGMRNDPNNLKAIRKFAVDKFNTILSGDEKYDANRVYKTSCIPVDRLHVNIGTFMIGFEALQIKWMSNRILLDFGKRTPKSRAAKALLKKGMYSDQDRWGLLLYCEGEPLPKLYERRK
jgi:hypothetical protein